MIYSFPISARVLNLLRDPSINNHKFDQQYLVALRAALEGLGCPENIECREIALYLHLILAQVENLE